MPVAFRVNDWRLPSPSSTPKSATFPDASFQTPRTDSYPSHFLEAWSTPRANVQQTPTQTPLYPRTGDRERPLSSYSHKSQDPEDPEFHINHYSPNPNLPLPPVEPSRRLASSPVPLTASQAPNDSAKAPLPSPSLNTSNMDTSQMQTPPPTRDATSSRKRNQDGQPLNFNTPSTLYSRRDSAPAIPANQTGDNNLGQSQGPPMFPSLQFTPEVSKFGHMGASTAPGPSRTGIFWNGGNSGEMMHFDNISAQDDPFGFTPGVNQNSFEWPSFTPSNTSRVDSASMAVADDSWTQTPSMLTTTSADLQSVTGGGSATLDDPFVPTTSGVDPSMLFSFSGSVSGLPSGMGNSWVSPQRPQKAPAREERQPYEQQTRESERQKEVSRKSSGHHSRTSTASSSGFAAAASRPGLQRSNTHAGFVRKSAVPSEALFGSATNTMPPVRKTSPLKRTNQSSLSAISEHVRTRPKTRLIVDESGRARAETVRGGDEDQKPATEYRTRYSGLWDDDSESESDRESRVTSRSTSFHIPSTVTRSGSRHSRTSSFMARSHSVKTPRSFSFTDNLSKRLGKLSTECTPRKPRDDSRRSSISSTFGGYLRKEIEPATDGGPGNDGGAQDALKKVVEKAKHKRHGQYLFLQGMCSRTKLLTRRSETISTANARMLEAHNQRWRASADVSKMNPGHGALFDPFLDNLSPSKATDASTLTPSTERSSASSEGTRCVCQSNEWDGQLMVQCESCTKWQHARCMGLPLKAELLPSVYVCVFCTGNTPVVRGGRVRDPYRVAPNPASPLAYKHRQ